MELVIAISVAFLVGFVSAIGVLRLTIWQEGICQDSRVDGHSARYWADLCGKAACDLYVAEQTIERLKADQSVLIDTIKELKASEVGLDR